ncbi:hypothetical protein SDC9_113084 [bioreactor metagenome]|uniref:Uncharacterized protein n=1 Tax=bioreactor metagenome TaxID=1076179 RepID=A0A645BLR5_9ZZZZ
MSKENRNTPVVASWPTIEIRMPRHPAMIPLSIFFPLTPAIIEIPKTARVKYSAGPKNRVTFAIGGAANSRTIALTTPPKTEAYRATIKADFARPFFARAYPSITVAAAFGVPGVFMSIAEIDPP